MLHVYLFSDLNANQVLFLSIVLLFMLSFMGHLVSLAGSSCNPLKSSLQIFCLAEVVSAS